MFAGTGCDCWLSSVDWLEAGRCPGVCIGVWNCSVGTFEDYDIGLVMPVKRDSLPQLVQMW